MRSADREVKPVTIKDIAREANVSYATVSRALSGNTSIREDTKRRVLAVCESMGYTANYNARSMVMRETNIIGIILPSIDNPFMSEMAYHIACNARERGYSIMLCNSSYDPAEEEKAFTLLLGRQVDGILIFPTWKNSCDNLRKYISKAPTVFINENLRDAPESYVAVDNHMGTRLGAEYLIGLGHRRILYFGRQTQSVTHSLRALGYEEALKESGLTPMIHDCTTQMTTIRAGYEMAMELFGARRDFTAVMASMDTLALGVMQAAEECGLSIPKDISLLGFDNIRYADLPRINLSTIEQPKRIMAETAMEMLMEKIQHGQLSYSHRILAPALVKRSSCDSPGV